jgi:small-conductance mechanosensitive channel
MRTWTMHDVERFLALPLVNGISNALVAILLAALASRLVVRALDRLLARGDIDAQRAMLLRRATTTTAVVVAALFAISALGVDLRVLLGAAGILSVAIGFASQTSASNLISGLFLIAERPFAVGDTIKIGETTGAVLSIDLLSVKLRTLDNLLVRVPNESVLKTEVTNLTRFPIRRFDYSFNVPFDANLAEVERVLLAIADDDPECLQEPKAQVFVEAFGDSGCRVRLSVWSTRERFLALRHVIPLRVKERLDAAGIGLGRAERRIIQATPPGS